MLEKIGTEGFRTISLPDADFIQTVKTVLNEGNAAPVVAELGLGIGATTVKIAEALDNRGQIHIYDFQEKVDQLKADLNSLGFHNIVGFGNTRRYWDSYHWSLAKLIGTQTQNSLYDVIYIDGAHTYLHDALAFFMCDRLLKPGGYIIFDDYDWRYANSRCLHEERHKYMTEEQIQSSQIGMLVDNLVTNHAHYEVIAPTKTFRKISNSTRGAETATD